MSFWASGVELCHGHGSTTQKASSKEVKKKRHFFLLLEEYEELSKGYVCVYETMMKKDNVWFNQRLQSVREITRKLLKVKMEGKGTRGSFEHSIRPWTWHMSSTLAYRQFFISLLGKLLDWIHVVYKYFM